MYDFKWGWWAKGDLEQISRPNAATSLVKHDLVVCTVSGPSWHLALRNIAEGSYQSCSEVMGLALW